MPFRFLTLVLIVVAFGVSLDAQSGQTGKPVIASVNDNQPTLAPAADLTVFENKLGIGTATPVFKLDVVGQVNGSGGLCMGGDCRTTWPGVTTGPWTTSGTSVLYGGGNVGIGGSSPAYKLDVTGQVNASDGLCISGDCRTSWPSVGGWTTSGSNISYAGNVLAGGYLEALNTIRSTSGNDLYLNANGASRDLFLQANGSTMMTLQGSTGNVGIGTASPIRSLQINRTNGNASIGLFTNGSERVVLVGANDGKFHLDVAGNPRVTVTGGGSVGIGTISRPAFSRSTGRVATRKSACIRMAPNERCSLARRTEASILIRAETRVSRLMSAATWALAR